jgi:hypothetical protein
MVVPYGMELDAASGWSAVSRGEEPGLGKLIGVKAAAKPPDSEVKFTLNSLEV